jgi:hypothetical protein
MHVSYFVIYLGIRTHVVFGSGMKSSPDEFKKLLSDVCDIRVFHFGDDDDDVFLGFDAMLTR